MASTVVLSTAPVTRSANKRVASIVDNTDMNISRTLKKTKTNKTLSVLDEAHAERPSSTNNNEMTGSVEDKPVIDIFVMEKQRSKEDGEVTDSDDDDIPPLEEVPVEAIEADSDSGEAVIGEIEHGETSPSKSRIKPIRIPARPVPPQSEAEDDDVANMSLCGSDVDKDDPMFTKPRPRVIRPKRTSHDLIKEYINPGTLTDRELKRIAGISIRGNQFSYRYPLTNLPLMAKWWSMSGLSSGSEDLTRFLAVYNSPLRVTVTGTVWSTYFFGPSGDPLPRVRIGIKPLRVQDLISYNALLNNKSNPPLDEERDVIYAGRFQTQRIRDRQAPICIPYHRVYDMRVGPTRKRAPKSAAMIAKRDIVMLECNVIRYRPAPQPGSGAKRAGKAWDTWLVGLELVDIIYLHEAPESGVEEAAPEVVEDGEEY